VLRMSCRAKAKFNENAIKRRVIRRLLRVKNSGMNFETGGSKSRYL